MAAHGYAWQGHGPACMNALRQSERALSAADAQERPEWLAYFDSAHLAAKFAHCFRDLGRPVESKKYPRESVDMTAGYDRGRG